MDPVGAAASILTFIAAGSSISKFISALHQAPSELIALQEERSNLRLVLEELVGLHRDCDVLKQNEGPLLTFLGRSREALEALDALVDQAQTSSQSKLTPHLWRAKWAARYKRKADSLIKDFDTVRRSLSAILNSRTLKVSNEIQVSLAGITVEAGRRADNQDLVLGSIVQRQVSDSTSILQKLQEAQAELDRLETGLLTDRRQQVETGLRLGNILTRQNNMLQLVYEEVVNGRLDQTRLQTGPTPRPYIKATRTKDIAACSKKCVCDCHQEHTVQSPKLLQDIMGEVKAIAKRKGCSISSCRNQQSINIKATWVLPSWMASQIASIAVSKVQRCGLSIQLKARVYSRDKTLHNHVGAGDLQSVCATLQTRKIAIDEIETGYGQSALVWAINQTQLDVCEFLIHEKADVMLEDFAGRTPRCVALMQILHEIKTNTSESLATAERLKSLFLDDNGFEEMNFSSLHEIVLGLRAGDLETELTETEVDINHQDRAGRTALYWAAVGNDVPTIKTLLALGADPSIRDNHGSSCLVSASIVRHAEARPTALRLLLRSKASIEPAKESGFTPLLTAAYHQNDVAFIHPLLAAGCDPNHVELRGQNSLMRATFKDRDITAKLLIESGVRLNHIDNHGDNVVMIATAYGANKVLRLLLERGADCSRFNHQGQTLFHIAAASFPTNVQTLKILHRASIRGIDVNSVDKNGATALQVLSERKNCSAEYSNAFFTLIQHVRPKPEARPLATEELDPLLTLVMS